jgi:hypothetical protein
MGEGMGPWFAKERREKGGERAGKWALRAALAAAGRQGQRRYARGAVGELTWG